MFGTLEATAVLLTYQGFKDSRQWDRFVSFVRANLRQWRAEYWCATFEESSSLKLHAHLVLQFRCKQDRESRGFVFEGILPNATGNDYLGEGICRKRFQQSVDRGFFYVWADKLGTQRDTAGQPCVAGNYGPAWTTYRSRYQVLGKWPEALWKQYKLSHAKFEEYLFASRDGVLARKRNLDAVREREVSKTAAAQIDARIKRIRGNSALHPGFPEVPAATEWLKRFETDAVRYPVLVVLGSSATGKTEWAKSLFQKPLEVKIGKLPFFPDGLRAFERGVHDGIILDDVRDMEFLTDHQEKIQGKYDALVEFATTPGGTCSYVKDLFAVPIVVTVNHSTKNLQYLQTHDWLASPVNRTVVNWPPQQPSAQ